MIAAKMLLDFKFILRHFISFSSAAVLPFQQEFLPCERNRRERKKEKAATGRTERVESRKKVTVRTRQRTENESERVENKERKGQIRDEEGREREEQMKKEREEY